MHLCETERERLKNVFWSLCLIVCVSRHTSLIHMLRQIRIFPSLISSLILSLTCQCSCRNAENEAFTRLVSKHWAHLNIRFVSLEELRSCRLSTLRWFSVSNWLC